MEQSRGGPPLSQQAFTQFWMAFRPPIQAQIPTALDLPLKFVKLKGVLSNLDAHSRFRLNERRAAEVTGEFEGTLMKVYALCAKSVDRPAILFASNVISNGYT